MPNPDRYACNYCRLEFDEFGSGDFVCVPCNSLWSGPRVRASASWPRLAAPPGVLTAQAIAAGIKAAINSPPPAIAFVAPCGMCVGHVCTGLCPSALGGLNSVVSGIPPGTTCFTKGCHANATIAAPNGMYYCASCASVYAPTPGPKPAGPACAACGQRPAPLLGPAPSIDRFCVPCYKKIAAPNPLAGQPAPPSVYVQNFGGYGPVTFSQPFDPAAPVPGGDDGWDEIPQVDYRPRCTRCDRELVPELDAYYGRDPYAAEQCDPCRRGRPLPNGEPT